MTIETVEGGVHIDYRFWDHPHILDCAAQVLTRSRAPVKFKSYYPDNGKLKDVASINPADVQKITIKLPD